MYYKQPTVSVCLHLNMETGFLKTTYKEPSIIGQGIAWPYLSFQETHNYEGRCFHGTHQKNKLMVQDRREDRHGHSR